jgi:hypothetical protein
MYFSNNIGVSSGYTTEVIMGQVILKKEIDIAAPEYLRVNRTTN